MRKCSSTDINVFVVGFLIIFFYFGYIRSYVCDYWSSKKAIVNVRLFCIGFFYEFCFFLFFVLGICDFERIKYNLFGTFTISHMQHPINYFHHFFFSFYFCTVDGIFFSNSYNACEIFVVQS